MQTENSRGRVLFASLIGTTIEFFDFYSYATAAVLVFPKLFFPASDAASATLQSFATFALAFFARPIGSAIFGHFGDRVGRKATLVAALLTMGISTVAIGLLPSYASIGLWAPALLALCRLGQGLGLGGEWGGAVLLATENAPASKRAWYGMFPQLGAPIGFICATSAFLLLGSTMRDADFLAWGWRIPFVASALLVFLGLYIRLSLTETPAFARAMELNQRVEVPFAVVFSRHLPALILGIFAAVATFVLFYLMTVFALSWSVNTLHLNRQDVLLWQIIGVVLFAVTIPISARFADRIGSVPVLIWVSVAIVLFGFSFAPLFGSGSEAGVLSFMLIGFALTGLTYGPLGTALAAIFPTAVRYTGSSLTFNFAGIVGASLAPYIATSLANQYGLKAVGFYLSVASFVSLCALLWIKASVKDHEASAEILSSTHETMRSHRAPSKS